MVFVMSENSKVIDWFLGLLLCVVLILNFLGSIVLDVVLLVFDSNVNFGQC